MNNQFYFILLIIFNNNTNNNKKYVSNIRNVTKKNFILLFCFLNFITLVSCLDRFKLKKKKRLWLMMI